MKRINFLICTFVCFVLLSANAYSQVSEPTGKILFVDIDKSGKTYLASINPNGTEKTRLTPPYNNLMFPRFNEKSGWIGFTNKTPDMKSEIYLLNKSGKKIKKILTDAALEDFSPDGKFFLFTSCNGKGELFVYSLQRKRAVKISQNLKIVSAAWSPKKEWIAVSALEADGSTDLYLISSIAMGIKRITQTPGINEAFPSFTNDGKYMIYFTNQSGKNKIVYREIETNKIQEPLISGTHPSLSPNNEWIVFQTGKTIGISRTDGLNQQTLVPGKTPVWIK